MKKLVFFLIPAFLLTNLQAEKILDPVEIVPRFPGGEKAYRKFLKKNLKMCDGGETQGRVIVSFNVEKNGRLTHFKIQRSLSPECDLEVIRVLKKSPKWIPSMENGKPVRAEYTVPVKFYFTE